MANNHATIRVSVRVRPTDDLKKNSVYCIEQGGNTNIKWTTNNQSPPQIKQFVFDNVYWYNNSQESIFQDIGQPIVYNALNGYNCSIFAYGQTGSGKSYTMFGVEGDPLHEGLIPKVCKALLNVKLSAISFPDANTSKISCDGSVPVGVAASPALTGNYDSCVIKISYIEIYLERVKDLLAGSTYDNKLKVREHPTTGTFVEGARLVELQTIEELQRLLAEGSRRRAMAVTRMNENSSRSHAVFTIVITQTLVDVYETVSKHSKVHLVDLAGSENNKSTGATGMRQREASYINRSLLTLGRVILALTKNSAVQARLSREGMIDASKFADRSPAAAADDNVSVYSVDRQSSMDVGKELSPDFAAADSFEDDEDAHTTNDDVCSDEHEQEASLDVPRKRRDSSGHMLVPYRDSVLTQLLRECIGGNAKTVLIATMRAEIEFTDDTISTLRFAGMARRVVNNASVNQQTFTMSTIERLQRQVSLLESELASSAQAMKDSDLALRKSAMSPSVETVVDAATREKQSEIEYLHATIRELTSQRDCARQVQQLQSEQIEEIRQKNAQREAKLLEDQRIKEEQIRFLMSIQSNSKATKEAAKRTSRKTEDPAVEDASGSEAELKGQEMFMCLSLKKASVEAARIADEVSNTPTCAALDSMAAKLLKLYSGQDK